MNDQDTIKRKNDLMNSIMSNKKMAKSFSDALSAPIGSTKRVQAKSIVSIMKKVGGLSNDGQGGPIQDIGNTLSSGWNSLFGGNSTPSTPSTPAPTNYGNMMVFPAAPKFKTPFYPTATGAPLPDTTKPADYGIEGNALKNINLPSVNYGTKYNNLFDIKHIEIKPTTNFGPLKNLPITQNEKKETPIVPEIKENTITKNNTNPTINIAANSVSSLLGITPDTVLQKVPVMDLASAIAANEGYFNGTSKVAIANNNPGNLKFANQPGATQDSSGFAVFKTADEGAQALINDLTAKYNSGKYSTVNDLMSVYSPDSDNPASSDYANGGNQTTPSSGLTYNDAQKYVDAGLGSYALGSDLAKASFGGKDLTQIINENMAEYNKSLEPIELQLSNLKAESENFIPTLTSYMQGRDQYSKAIDSMIKSAEDQLLTTNMADPYTANQYNNNLTYLYTLKGRQNARYGTYLNSAISDYNADVTKMETTYNNFKTNATDLLNQKNTLDQSTYNDLMTRGAALYTELQDAPTKAYNLGILKQQYYQNGGDSLANGINSGVTTNPKYQADLKADIANIAIDKGSTDNTTGTIDWTTIPVDGLIGLYTQNAHAGSDEAATTEAIRRVFAKTLEVNSDPKTVAKIKKMISDLSANPQTKIFGDTLAYQLQSGTSSSWSGYILPKVGEIKNAIKDLVASYGGFLGFGKKAAGIQDKARWIADHSSLSPDFLEALYNTINNSVQAGTTYAANPQSIINEIFSGKNDQENANNLASIMAASS